jgi:hydrogenase maturation protein HypF
MKKCVEIRVTGLVQGVGFRPFVYNLAIELNLSGYVKNDGKGIVIELEGYQDQIEGFNSRLETESPILSKIESIKLRDLALKGFYGFKIEDSDKTKILTSIIPDAATCEDCIKDLFNPDDKQYYGYPFLNCTHCGPRYTITYALPYDRENTSMRSFDLCADCKKVYSDPKDRRFHAQPTACVNCGPKLSHNIADIMKAINSGHIVAIKSLGGFHLVCDAKNGFAIKQLRIRKNRDAKPFAVMSLNVKSVEEYLSISKKEQELLECNKRPIVVLEVQKDFLPKEISPGLNNVGVMLPYTPLHYLLFWQALGQPKGYDWLEDASDVLFVMTSANISDEPLIIDNVEAKDLLIKNTSKDDHSSIADMIVDYNRDIVTRVDDSVVKVISGYPTFIRRARGYIPGAIKLGKKVKPVLALGGSLKNTVCITRGDQAFVSQYLGDIDDVKTIKFFRETIEHMLKLLDVKPEYIVHDLHPDFYSTQLAKNFGVPTFAVQHHYAHFAAVLAEHIWQEPCLGLVLDGFGYGLDGTAWGGELLCYDSKEISRVGHLLPIDLPGGDNAAKESWRVALAILHKIGRGDVAERLFSKYRYFDQIKELLDKGFEFPQTTSCGRLFDAASAILGVTYRNEFEGQAPMMLESMVNKEYAGEYSLLNEKENILSFLPLFEKLLDCNKVQGASLFHSALIVGVSDWIVKAAKNTGINTVAFSGGCMINKVLVEGLIKTLSNHKIKVLLHKKLSPNDGGISLGQAWYSSLFI